MAKSGAIQALAFILAANNLGDARDTFEGSSMR